MSYSSEKIEEGKKYIRENFMGSEGYLTQETLKEENELKESCRTFTDDLGNVIQIESFNEEDCEKRQRRDDFFGNLDEYCYLQESEIYEVADIPIELPPDTSERRVWDDEGLSETEEEYYRRVCYWDYSSHDFPMSKNSSNNNKTDNKYEKEPLTMIEERFLKDFNFDEDTPEAKTNPVLKEYLDNNKKISVDMLRRHMMQQIFKLLQADDYSTEHINSWYNDLVERANSEAVNRAYLKGYRDGHRDGYNDCMRGKKEDDYKFPEVENSGYDRFFKKEILEEIPF